MIPSTKMDQNRSFWCQGRTNHQDQEVCWALEVVEASEVAEATEVNEAGVVSKA